MRWRGSPIYWTLAHISVVITKEEKSERKSIGEEKSDPEKGTDLVEITRGLNQSAA
jgi:hypothetical protein